MANDEERHELFVALLGAVDADDLEVQQQILKQHPPLLAMSDLEGRTAIHRAAGRGMALSLTHLISMSPDLGIVNVSARLHTSLALVLSNDLSHDYCRYAPTPIVRLCTSVPVSATSRASRLCLNAASTSTLKTATASRHSWTPAKQATQMLFGSCSRTAMQACTLAM